METIHITKEMKENTDMVWKMYTRLLKNMGEILMFGTQTVYSMFQ